MSFNEWQILTLDDIADIIMGQSPSGDTCNNDGIGSPLLNGPTEFGEFYPTAVQFTTDPKKFSQEGDILFCVRGSTTGRMNWSNSKYAIGRGLAAFRHKLGLDYQHYLKGIIDLHLNDLLFQATGSTFPNVSSQQLKGLKVKVPNSQSQLLISKILSSFNSKIENNLAANQTLEEIARTLFKEWFVNFNYPNEDGKLKHSEFGEIPENWSIGSLSDIYKTTSGGTPSRSKAEYYENGTIGWIKSKELNNSFIIDTEEKITEDALKKSSAKLLPKYSVLIAMYGATVGEIGVTTKEFTCNQAICSFLPNENYPFSFIYNFLLNSKQDIIGRAIGSAQQNISQQLLLQYKLVIPPSELVQEYHRIVFPIFQKIQDNIEENESLRELRNNLLPKLMSGEVDLNVSNK